MRTRLAGLLLGLLATVLLALVVPLGLTLTSAAQQRVYLDRLGDATRLASVAGRAGTPADLVALRADLQRYEDVYGIAAQLLDRNGQSVVSSARPPDLGAPGSAARQRVDVARTGRRGDPPAARAPWDTRPLVVAEPVVRGGDVTGVLVTASPTRELALRATATWALLVLAALALLAGSAWLAGRMARWVLRPVSQLDQATHAVSTGRLSTRVVATDGPPELRNLAVAFNEMAGSVEALLAQQAAFVADASHQLRNPLGALLLRLEEVALTLPPGSEEQLDAVRAEGQRLARVLDELLELARAEHVAGAPVPVDVDALLTDRAAAWAPVAARREVGLVLERAAAVVGLADPVGLSSALDAVVDNAVKFTPPGGQVRLSARREGQRAVLVVADDGPGLADDELERVGDRFWRSPRHANVPGSGLGLAVARSLLAAHGGALRAGHGAPTGLVVRLEVPAATAVPAPAGPGRGRLGARVR